jgi:hypothetical protein
MRLPNRDAMSYSACQAGPRVLVSLMRSAGIFLASLAVWPKGADHMQQLACAMSPTLIVSAPGMGCTMDHSPSSVNTSSPGTPSWGANRDQMSYYACQIGPTASYRSHDGPFTIVLERLESRHSILGSKQSADLQAINKINLFQTRTPTQCDRIAASSDP